MYVSMKEMLKRANDESYAVMAINCFNLETARAIIKAAELENAPIILNIVQEHLLNHSDSELITPMIKILANRTKVEIALNLDHGENFECIEKVINDGFSSVMVDGSKLSLEDNIKFTASIVEIAKRNDISVEGEIGCMGASADERFTNIDMLTNPKEAYLFASKTGIDALAVSIGTSHGNYPKGMVPKFDFKRLKEIKEFTGMPLVLHGGSGSGEENIKKAVKYGINKINVGCDFFNACTEVTKDIIYKNPSINYFNLVKEVEEKSIDKVRYYIRLAGSNNKSK